MLGKLVTSTKKEGSKLWKTPHYQTGSNRYQNNCDPNAMDIDHTEINAMEQDERNTLLKKGGCFNCKQTGHMA